MTLEPPSIVQSIELQPSPWSDANAALRRRVLLSDGWKFLHENETMAETGLPPFYASFKNWILPARNAFVSTGAFARPAGSAPEAPVYVRPDFDYSGWRVLSVPHDWAIEGPFRQEFPGGTGKLPWLGVGGIGAPSPCLRR